MAYRSIYSLFDKIAVFLNEYLRLGIDPNGVDFRSLWYEQVKGKPWKLRGRFRNYENLPLRGLFWLSKDLAANDPHMREAIEPEARNLKIIRNHLEHKYLSVHEMGPAKEGGNAINYAISRRSLEEKALKLMKLGRSALMYLAMGMHREEELRKKDAPSGGFVVEQELPILPDNWKRRF